MLNIKKSYTFDDVLLIPKKSNISHRADVDLSVNWGKGIKTGNPIVNANMKTVASPELVSKLVELGGMGLLHRFTDDRIKDYNNTLNLTNKEYQNNIGVSVGISESEKEFLSILTNSTNCKIVCVDIAHAHSADCLKFVEYVSTKYPDVLLIAGNVATAEGARDLMDAGANVIKIGIGSSAICSTRVQTGNGVSMLTAISDIAEELRYHTKNGGIKLISDGGLRTVGNMCKANCFTTGFMLGSFLAGCTEAPGKIIELNGDKYKEYVGSSTYRGNFVEGITSRALCKGPLENTVKEICQGLQSCCSYQGVNNLLDLKLDPQFVELSPAGMIETQTHAIIK